jgi:hypothetical protein
MDSIIAVLLIMLVKFCGMYFVLVGARAFMAGNDLMAAAWLIMGYAIVTLKTEF